MPVVEPDLETEPGTAPPFVSGVKQPARDARSAMSDFFGYMRFSQESMYPLIVQLESKASMMAAAKDEE